MDTLVEIAERSCEEAYDRVDAALREQRVDFSREGHKYLIPNFPHLYPAVVNIASNALRGLRFHATEIPYREMKDRTPEFMAVLHLDDETYTFLC